MKNKIFIMSILIAGFCGQTRGDAERKLFIFNVESSSSSNAYAPFIERRYETFSATPPSTQESTSLGNLYSTLQSYIWSHKWTIAIGTIAVAYGVLFCKIFWLSSLVDRADTWSGWKQHISLGVLRQMSFKQIRQDFFHAAEEKYSGSQGHYLLSLLVESMNDIKQEQKSLMRLINFYDLLKRSRLLIIFPCQEQTVVRAAEKVERLNYIEELVTAWVNELLIAESIARKNKNALCAQR